MRVIQVIPTLSFGGAEREVIRTAVALCRAGHDCRIVCLKEEGGLAREAAAKGVLLYSRAMGSGSVLRRALNTVRLLNGLRPDIVHCHLVSWLPVAARLSGANGVVVTEHGVSIGASASRVFADRFAALWADAVVAVAEAVRDARLSRWKTPVEKLHLIPNAIDASRFAFVPDRDGTRTALGIPPDHGYVVAVGRLEPVKGHRYLLEAIAILRDMGRPAYLVIVGDGPCRQELEQVAAELGIRQLTRFLGFRTDVEAILKAADAFVLPSLSEGTSVAALEAMAARLPVVATSVGGNPELIVHESTGLLVKPQDPGGLATAIDRVFHDEHLASSLVENALATVCGRYSAERHLAALESLYCQIASSAQ